MIKFLNNLFNAKKEQYNIHGVSNNEVAVCEHLYWHRAGFMNIGVCNDCGANFYIKQTDC